MLYSTFQETLAEFGMLTGTAKYQAGAEAMVMRSHVSRLPFANGRGRSRPGTLPTAPNRDVVKPEFVPPPIKHRLIETQDSVLGDARRRRREFSQPIVDEHSLLLRDTGQKVPQGKCIALARRTKYDREIPGPLLRCAVLKIESCQSGAELGRRIFEYGVPGPISGLVEQAAPAGIKDS